MLSLEQAYKHQERYRGNEACRRAIGETTLLAFAGGVAAGKNHLMEASGYHVVGTETTREKRFDDNPQRYTYSSHDEMLEAISTGELVQYGIATKDGIPTDIYGSRASDYQRGGINVSDIWADAVHTLDNKGFKAVRAVSVFTPKAQWINQLSLRLDGMSYEKVESRLSEARYSIRWSLAQHLSGAANHLIIINDANDEILAHNVSRIADFAQGEAVEPIDDELVRETTTGMFEAIDTIYSRMHA